MGYRTAEQRVAKNEYMRERYRLNRRARIKQNARTLAGHAIIRGELIRGPCEVCGSAFVQSHHDDYSKPLVVRWLCAPDHREWHRVNGEATLGPAG